MYTMSIKTNEELQDYVAANPNRKTLVLRGCNKITDAGLEHLKGLVQLTLLDLSGCNTISHAAVAEFKKARPNCVVVRN